MATVGTKENLLLDVTGTQVRIPATRIAGAQPGERIALSAGVHCREYIGIQALMELAEALDPAQIAGEILILRCCNYRGLVQRSPDVMPEDGENLNRVFPGDPAGGSTQRVAAWLVEQVIRNTDYLVDLHSGGFCEALTPHVYFHGSAGEAVCRKSLALAEYTGAPYLVRSRAQSGFYSYAGQVGVPAIILERGGCGLVNRDEIAQDIRDVKNILRGLGFLRDGTAAVHPAHTVIDRGFYEDSPLDGCWYPAKAPGDPIREGETIGCIRDIYGNPLAEIRAKCTGVILYQTASLGIQAGTPMVAYGEIL